MKKNALITGGARGIGAAISKDLASGEAQPIQADVRSDKSIENMFNKIKGDFGGVDILVSKHI